MNVNLFHVWLGVMVLIILAASLIRKYRGQNLPTTGEFIVAGFAWQGAISFGKVLLKIASDKKLQTELELDGSVALGVGALLGIVFSIKEVIKLFTKKRLNRFGDNN